MKNSYLGTAERTKTAADFKQKYKSLPAGKRAKLVRSWIENFGCRNTLFYRLNGVIKFRPIEKDFIEKYLNT